jgi:DNA repair ATPase RecN
MIPPMRSLCSLTLLCAVLAPGCSTPRAYDLAAGTARRMTETSKTCTALSSQIGQTTGSLQSVVANARSDPREAYAAYAHNVTTLGKLVEETQAACDTLDKEGRTYFAEWEKSNHTIGDEALRKKADARRADLREEFTNTLKKLQGALEELGPFSSQLQDVRAYLSSDLSSAGIESLRGRIGDLGSKGRSIQKQLTDVNESVQKILPDLGTFASAPQKSEPEADRVVH